jgi:hypothetical protein
LKLSSYIRSHIRNNIVGYVALFVALSGVAYATDGPLPGQNQVGSEDIIDTEVHAPDIKNGAVTSNKVANQSLVADDLAPKAVGYSELDPAAFASGDIAPGCIRGVSCNFGIPLNAIQSNEIQDGQVKNADLADNAVRSAEIQDGQVTKADLASGVIPAGPAGYAAFDDDTGIICNDFCTEGSLKSLPAGSYAISAKIEVDQKDLNADQLGVKCRLSAGADFDESNAIDYPGGNTAAAIVPMQLVHTFASDGGTASVDCRDFDFGDAHGRYLKITAIRLGSLSNVHSSSG